MYTSPKQLRFYLSSPSKDKERNSSRRSAANSQGRWEQVADEELFERENKGTGREARAARLFLDWLADGYGSEAADP
jgi:hypothetical protein